PQHPEHEPPARIGGVDAVVPQLVPRLVLVDALVHPVRLDQAEERLTRQVELTDRRLDVPQYRPRGAPLERRADLALELVERREPVALERVPDLVDEPRVAVEGADVRTQRPGE